MKICLINNLYKPFNRGGAERIVEIMAKQFDAGGHEVFIIATSPLVKKQPGRLDYEINYVDKVKVYFIKTLYYNLDKIPIFARLFWHGWDTFDFITVKKVKKILKNENPDLVITNNLKGLSYLLPKEISNLRLKHIHILHDMQLLYPSGALVYGHEKRMESLLAKLYMFICADLFAGVKIVVSPSKWLMQEHEKRNFFKNSHNEIIRSPFNGNTGASRGGEYHETNKKFIFLYIGQIEKHKGILFLITCFNNFCKNHNAVLQIVGDGTILDEAKALAGDRITFYGQVKSEKINGFMEKANCLIVPSLCYENSPTVIYEAITSGLPIVASQIGGITELMLDYGGVLFNPGDERQLSAGMDRVMANYLEIKKRYLYKYQDIEKNNASKYIEKIINLLQ